MRLRGGVAAALLALASAGAVAAQQPQAAVIPQSITVGDVFHAAVRLELPPGATLGAPDTLALPEHVELAGRREVRVDTADGARRVTLIYPLSAWRPGEYALQPVDLRVVADGSERTMAVSFPAFAVRSVLPADTAGIQPREAKDVLGANRLWWPILLALLLAAAVAAALWYWWKRRRRPVQAAPAVAVVRVPPRDAALQQLAALRTSGLLERGEFKEFYVAMTEALRHYLAALHPAWSADLTTAELAPRLRASTGVRNPAELAPLLAAADLVKFARRPATATDALRDLDLAVYWVEQAEPAADAEGTDSRRVA